MTSGSGFGLGNITGWAKYRFFRTVETYGDRQAALRVGLVAHAVFRGGYVLYTPVAWEFFGMHAYESDGTGNIQLNGRPTGWHIKDLTDAGRTARSRSRSGAAQQAFIG